MLSVQAKLYNSRCGGWSVSSVRSSSRRTAVRYGRSVVVLESQARLDDILLLYDGYIYL